MSLVSMGPPLTRWFINVVHDRDRAEFETAVSNCEQSGMWDHAASLLSGRLQKPVSAAWRQELERRLFEDLLVVALVKSKSAEELHLTEAKELTEQRTRGAEIVAALEQGQRDEAALAKTQIALSEEQSAAVELRKELAGNNLALVQSQAERQELATQLSDAVTARAALSRQVAEATQQQTDLSQDIARTTSRHVSTLADWGDWLRHEAERAQEKYDEALILARQRGLPTNELEQRLSSLQIPPDPAASTSLQIIGGQRIANQLRLDAAVLADDGRPLLDLTRRDFRVLVADQPWERWTVERANWTTPHAIAICLDISGSMKGLPFEAAKAATQLLPESFPNANFELLAFSDTVRVTQSWTKDHQAIHQTMIRLSPAGGTAFFKAVEQAAQEIGQMPGRRSIVVCTDGRDSVGGITLSQAVDRCREAEATVYVVSLETKDADLASLQSLASQTGGFVVTASEPSQLAAAFQTVAKSLMRSAYHFTILDVPEDSTVRIRLGVKRPIEATWTRRAPRGAFEPTTLP